MGRADACLGKLYDGRHLLMVATMVIFRRPWIEQEGGISARSCP